MMHFVRHARGRGSIPPTFATTLPHQYLASERIHQTRSPLFGLQPVAYAFTLRADIEAWLTEMLPRDHWWCDLELYPRRLFIRGENNALAFQMRWG